ncbi:MAG: RNA polymerase sigma factor [Egibacteraceae bacterium]
MTTQITASTTDLVRAAAEGDERAWELMVRRYSGQVWSAVRTHRLAGSDAAEVVATIWLQLAQNLTEIREPEAVGAWLATTARTESLRALRLIDCERPMESLDQLESADRPEDEPEAQAAAAEGDLMLLQRMDELPERDQALLRVLLVDPPLSDEEISSTLGMPINSIRPARARCLQGLRRRMSQFEHPTASIAR